MSKQKKQLLPQKKQTQKVLFQVFDDTARITNNNSNIIVEHRKIDDTDVN